MIDPITVPSQTFPVTTESIINLLGVVYAHAKTEDGGDLYLTEYGLLHADLLDIDNWYESEWFETHRVRLSGTSSVFRVPTKEVEGHRLQLVVKNNRVGEDVPLNTHTLLEFINAEFNSPWEEFALTMELRENKFGPRDVRIRTQEPLAIYVPSEKLQLWQTGRSRERINKIALKHPNVNIDILRQYKMVYRWIEGLSIVEALREIGMESPELEGILVSFTTEATRDMEKKGFIVADMKPSHVIIEEEHVREMRDIGAGLSLANRDTQIGFLSALIKTGRYSIVDYELLMRTPGHEEQVKYKRRHLYLDDQRDRFQEAPLPPFLSQCEIDGVPYVHGHVESTGGLLWVVGRNPRLYDYFLPERWRKTPCQQLSKTHEVFYTVTKDNIHIVWKTSRAGEPPQPDENGRRGELVREYGYNNPFEEFAIAHRLTTLGVPTVYVRAVYMTGSMKTEPAADLRHFESYRGITARDGFPAFRENHDYITIQGYYNGIDSWVASHEGGLCTPFDLERAGQAGVIAQDECQHLMDITRSRLSNVGYDGSLLEMNDILISFDPDGRIVTDAENLPEARICNFELIHKAH